MAEQSNYWNRRLLNRRTLLRMGASAGGATAAAALVACGGNSSNNNKNTAAAGASVTSAAAPSTAAAGRPAAAGGAAPSVTPTPAALDSTKGKPGGTLKYYINGYPGSLSAIDHTSAYHFAGLARNALLGFRWGQASVAIDDYTMEPDFAMALPEQPDQTTYTFKLRPNVKFSNGRVITADDVKYSLDRYATYEKSAFLSTWQAWYDHSDTPDQQTIVIKSKFPYADAVTQLGGQKDGYIMAKEHEEGPDAGTSIVGAGPFLFVSEQTQLSDTFKKNPDYYATPYPYFDQVQVLIPTDAVKRTTDFLTHQVDMPWTEYAIDAAQVKQQRPDAQQTLINNWTGSSVFMRNDKPPFNDARVRQALSMAIDRKKIGDLSQGEHFPDQFFPIMLKNVYGTSEVKDLGDSTKFWNNDPQAAKQLMSAAGIDKPIESTMSHLPGSLAGQFFADQATLVQAQWKALGLADVKDNEQQVGQYAGTTAIGNYDGMGLFPGSPVFTGVGRGAVVKDNLWTGPNGEHSPLNIGYVNNPQLSALILTQLGQFNAQERAQTWRQMEAIMAAQQYWITLDTLQVFWFADPSVKNFRLHIEAVGPRRCAMRWWKA